MRNIKIATLAALFGLLVAAAASAQTISGSTILQTRPPGSGGPTADDIANYTISKITNAAVLYASNYGVVANGKTATDVGCTSGSASITSASFTPANQTTPPQVINIYCGTNAATTGTTTSGSRVITSLGSTTGLAPMQSVVGTNIPAGCYLVAVDTTNSRGFLNQSCAATGSGSVSLTFINQISTTITTAGNGVATIATAAGTTASASRAHFGTDDTDAWRAAITAAGGVSGTNYAQVIGPSGVSMITGTINDPSYNSGNWPASVSLVGQQRDVSVLRWASAQSMGDSPGLRAVVWAVRGSYAASSRDVVFANYTIDLSAATDSPYNYNGSCFRFVMNRNVTITNMKFIGSPATCLGIDNPQRMLVHGNIFENNARLGTTGGGSIAILFNETIFNPEDMIVSNNHIYNTGVFGVMWENFWTTSANPTISDDTVIVTGNHIYYDAFQPNATVVYGIQDSGGFGSIITNNFVKGPAINSTQFVGIGMACGDKSCFNTGGGFSPRISNNTVIGMGTPYYFLTAGSNNGMVENNYAEGGGRSTTGCFAVNNNADGTSRAMTGWTFRQNKGINCAGGGLVTTAGNATANVNWTIQNNFFANNGTVGGSRAGILFSTPQNGALISGNRAYDNSTGMQQYGLQAATGVALTNLFVTGNDFTGNGVAAVNAAGTMTGVFSNNLGMPAPTISGCSATTPTGNGTIGTYTSGTTGACDVTITPFGTSNIIANNGWLCTAFDRTTTANIHTQTAYTTTTATISGTTTSGDVIAFKCDAW